MNGKSDQNQTSFNADKAGDITCQELARAELPLPRLSQSSQAFTAGGKKKEKCPTTGYFPLFQHQTVLSGEREPFASYLNTGSDGQSSEV